MMRGRLLGVGLGVLLGCNSALDAAPAGDSFKLVLKSRGTPATQLVALMSVVLDRSIAIRPAELERVVIVGDDQPHELKPWEVLPFIEARFAEVGLEVIDLGPLLVVRERERLAADLDLDVASPFVAEADLASVAPFTHRVVTLVRLDELDPGKVDSAALRRHATLSGTHVIALDGPAREVVRFVESARRVDSSHVATPSPARTFEPVNFPASAPAPSLSTIELQFDEIDGTPLADFSGLLAQTIGVPVHCEPKHLDSSRVAVVHKLRVERDRLRELAEAILFARGFDFFETADGFTISRAPPIPFDDPRLFVPTLSRPQLDGEADRFQIVRAEIPVAHADAAAVAELMQSWRGDPAVESITADAQRKTITLRGHGRNVLRDARMIEEIDRLVGLP